MKKILLTTKNMMKSRAAGIPREELWIQHLPQGDFAVACYETNDPEQSFKVIDTYNEA
jgi:hypothetical protein